MKVKEIKKSKIVKKLVFIWSFMLLGITLSAQKPKIEISVSSNQVSTSETFNLVLTLSNGDGIEEIIPPNLSSFQVFGDPSRSSNSSISIINGKRQMTKTLTYTYRLQAKKEGKFTVGPVTATGPGIEIKSNKVTIEVVKGAAGNSNINTNNQGLFVAAEANKRTAVVGEPIVVSYKIYLKTGNLDDVEKIDIPQNPGFWKEDVEIEQKWETKLINGVRYNVVEVERHILFPQKAGDLEIGSFEFTALIGTGGWFNHSRKRMSSKSRPVKIKVNPLPAGKPQNFLGTFESLKMNESAKPNELKAHEAIDYKITFTGRGNLKLINAPSIEFPSDFEVYDPKVVDHITIGKYFESGKRTFEYLILPRSEGDFVLPKTQFSYYDYKEKKYKYLSAPEKKFHVLPGVDDGNQNYLFNSKNEVNVLNQDIRFIRTDVDSLSPKNEVFFGSKTHYLLLGLPLVMFLGFFVVQKRKESIQDNPEAYKMNKAGRVARKHLAKAKALINQGKSTEFYEAISGALFGYMQDKYGISMSEMSKENIRKTLIQKGSDGEVVNQLIDALETCEIAQYAPVQNTSEDKMYQQASEVIQKMEMAKGKRYQK